MGRQMLLIWGGLIFFYLAVINRQGTASFISSLQNFVGGTTKVLQGR